MSDPKRQSNEHLRLLRYTGEQDWLTATFDRDRQLVFPDRPYVCSKGRIEELDFSAYLAEVRHQHEIAVLTALLDAGLSAADSYQAILDKVRERITALQGREAGRG